MTTVSEWTLRLMRQSAPEGDALVPIRDMAPHFMSRRSDLETSELTYLFPVNLDGTEWHVYLRTG